MMTDQIVQTIDFVWRNLPALPARKEVERIITKEVEEMLPQKGMLFVRLAGLSGATAVMLGAYGAHAFRNKEVDEQLKHTYDTGNRYHFMHSLALLAVPLTRRPYLVGTLLTSGIILFSGSCYYHALTENKTVRKVTPYGGMCFIAAWLAIVL